MAMEVENIVVPLVTGFDQATREMISWLRGVRPERVTPLYLGSGDVEDAAAQWERMAPRLGSLQRLRVDGGGEVRALRAYVRGIARGADDFITIVVPEEVTTGLFRYLLRRTQAFRIKTAFLFEPGVVVTDIPLLPEEVATAGHFRPLEPERNVCLVPISGVHDASIRALADARSLQPAHLEAVFLAGEAEEADDLLRDWQNHAIDISLTVVEAPFREYGPPMLEEIRRHTARGDTIVTVVMPEFVVESWRHTLLHNQRALFFKRTLLFEPWVVAVSVPYHLGTRREAAAR